jgi:hypothetical protein
MSDRESATRLFRHARREAIVVIIVWALALTWTVGYCYLRGYQHDETSWVVQQGLAQPHTPDDFRQIAGLPEWVFFGILLPWLACTAFTIGFCLFGMTDDDLGREAEEGGRHGH